jgi:hypothetical protein
VPTYLELCVARGLNPSVLTSILRALLAASATPACVLENPPYVHAPVGLPLSAAELADKIMILVNNATRITPNAAETIRATFDEEVLADGFAGRDVPPEERAVRVWRRHLYHLAPAAPAAVQAAQESGARR